ncbi:hypothetical protein Tco_1238038 [Tanacetum coccineum]
MVRTIHHHRPVTPGEPLCGFAGFGVGDASQTHPKPALHPIDVENYDASHSDDEDEAEKDVAASYRIE